ncbi:MAG TPA: alpha/beta hydrolase [Cyclobacteriaceae bacterium]|nr:alpha/beta hydrolase [Cyclobacteriaceae bacterium]
MKVKAVSKFKNPPEDLRYFESWVNRLEKLNGTQYGRKEIATMLGKTVVWTINTNREDLKTLIIFPGFRTCSLFWDFDNGLQLLKERYRIFLVDTNGQPCLSDGNTPDIRSEGYGEWAAEVLETLKIRRAVIAGASFGGTVCMKLSALVPDRIEKVVLLNPGCLQNFSLSWKNLYYNMLPILFPSKGNVKKFLDNAVFCKPTHQLSPDAEELIIDYEHFALTRFIDKGDKPYKMSEEELLKVKSDVYLLEGDHDLLFPFEKSIAYAKKSIQNLREVHVLKETGHGIETSSEAMRILAGIMEK